jgi:hypothetical protein
MSESTVVRELFDGPYPWCMMAVDSSNEYRF